MNNLLHQYIKYKKFSPIEEEILNTPIEYSKRDNTSRNIKIEEQYFDKMLFSNVNTKNRYLRIDESGSALIRKVFEREITPDTLVISTSFEHPTVVECLEKCQHTHLLNHKTFNLDYLPQLIDKAKTFKKILVYIIGTKINTGEILSQLFLNDLKNSLVENNLEHCMLLDDVHGMFMVPRDYSIFDYVLYTAHAIIPKFEMGLLVSKHNDVGYYDENILKEYLKRLDLLLSIKDKSNLFKITLSQYFSKELMHSNVSLYENTCNHIFALKLTDLPLLEKDVIALETFGIPFSNTISHENSVRIRFQEFVREDYSTNASLLSLIKASINRAILLKEMKGE